MVIILCTIGAIVVIANIYNIVMIAILLKTKNQFTNKLKNKQNEKFRNKLQKNSIRSSK